jgi:hypothetical protein
MRYLLILLLCALPGVVAAQTPPLQLETYTTLLREAQSAAERGDRISLDLAVAQLAPVREVALPDGGLAPADTSWLAAELARPNPRLDRLAARLDALVELLDPVAPPPPADAEQRLERILAGPPFARPTAASQEPSWFDRFLEWLGELLGDVAAPVGEAAGGRPGSLASWIIVGVSAALLLGVLVFWLRGLRASLRPAVALRPVAAEARDAADARVQAASLAQSGNYRAAVRLLALASLLWLDERGALRYNPHQTNREHLARLREPTTLRQQLAPVVETADRVWYGNAPLDAAGYAAYEQQVAELGRAAERGAVDAP